MKQRIITGLILIVIALLWLFASYELFLAGCFLVLTVGAYEFAQLVFANNFVNTPEASSSSVNLPPNCIKKNLVTAKIGYTFSAIVITALIYVYFKISMGDFTDMQSISVGSFTNVFAVHPLLGVIFVLAGIWWVISLVLVLTYPKNKAFFKLWYVKATCGYLTLIPFFFALLFLRVQNYDISSNFGAVVLLSLMALVWAADSGAYFTGRLCGKHKMSPYVSPNKTIEGLLGGLILAMVVFVLVYFLSGYGSLDDSFAEDLSALVIGVIVAVIFSVVGDLAESMFKREANIKDSGIIFPGHGGMLDRIDSLTAALPCFLLVYGLLA